MLRDHLPSPAMEGQAGREPWSGFVPSPGLRIALQPMPVWSVDSGPILETIGLALGPRALLQSMILRSRNNHP
jgi:hypothetical protein